MKQLLNTLFVLTPGAYLRVEGETICVEIEREKKMQIPLLHLSSVVLFGDVMFSPSCAQRCLEAGRTMTLLDRNGRFIGRMEGKVSGNVLLRVAQHKAAEDSCKSAEIARSIIAGKLKNSRQMLLRSARDSTQDEAKNELKHAAGLLKFNLEKLSQAKEVDSIRGIEGDSARIYFGCFDFHLKEVARRSFPFEKRSKRPPLNNINALLSFLYTLLLTDCRSALESVGLDPQVGFLHLLRPGRVSLALDVCEEFRSFIADRLAVTLINRAQIQDHHFQKESAGAVFLNDEGRKIVITAYQERKKECLTHPLLTEKIELGLIPFIQARLLARYLRGETVSYLPFIAR